MGILLGCIADDYTGASDLANTITKAGLRTIQTIGLPEGDLPISNIDAVVVSLKSRSILPAEAVEKSLQAYRWLRANGASHVLFKICSTFDSTDAGNIGPVMDALQSDSGDSIVVVTPAFPETQRTVYQGNLFVGQVPLNESPLKDHPLNPMHDANLMRVLDRQSRAKISLINIATVRKGAEAIRSQLDRLAQAGVTAAIVDAIEDSDLTPIGAVALNSKLSVGASGLGLGLAQALVRRGAKNALRAASFDEPVGGPAVCLAGSCSQATLAQIASAEKKMPVLRLKAERFMSTTEEVCNAISWALAHLEKSPVVISSSSSPDDLKALQSRFGVEASGRTIEQSLATIAEHLVGHGLRRLIVAGGETSGAIVDRLKIRAFKVGEEIAPGVPILRSIGPKDRQMAMALKSGNFGDAEFFEKALKKII
jgi:3-dehydrotetronate 4-kinase